MEYPHDLNWLDPDRSSVRRGNDQEAIILFAKENTRLLIIFVVIDRYAYIGCGEERSRNSNDAGTP